MFPVGRFDPKKEISSNSNQKNKKKKTKRDDKKKSFSEKKKRKRQQQHHHGEDDNEGKSLSYVIAPDVESCLNHEQQKQQQRLQRPRQEQQQQQDIINEEAFDDLDFQVAGVEGGIDSDNSIRQQQQQQQQQPKQQPIEHHVDIDDDDDDDDDDEGEEQQQEEENNQDKILPQEQQQQQKQHQQQEIIYIDDDDEEDDDDEVEIVKVVNAEHSTTTTPPPPPTTTTTTNDDDDNDDDRDDLLLFEEMGKQYQIKSFLMNNLRKDGIRQFFPIQSMVIPDIISSERLYNHSNNSSLRVRDVCVSSPTGSGKTLAFVIPILNVLSSNNNCYDNDDDDDGDNNNNDIARRQQQRSKLLRALVVLPSRDLAQQVHRVFEKYSQGSDLVIGLAIGQSDFKKEQMEITCCVDHNNNNNSSSRSSKTDKKTNKKASSSSTTTTTTTTSINKRRRRNYINNLESTRQELLLNPENADSIFNAFDDDYMYYSCYNDDSHDDDDDISESTTKTSAATKTNQSSRRRSSSGGGMMMMMPRGGRSSIDILVCTPGRLVDHLDNTPGFTLQHLRFLVVDEADRLLSQTYHNWINRVIESTNTASIKAWHQYYNNESSTTSSSSSHHHHKKTIDTNTNHKNHNKNSRLCYKYSDPITWRRGGIHGDYDTTFSLNTTSNNIKDKSGGFHNNNNFKSDDDDDNNNNNNNNDDAFGGHFGTNVIDTVCRPIQLRKLLYSATLTHDPQKLASLRLVNPKFMDASSFRGAGGGGGGVGRNRYSMPQRLLEHTVECTAEQKVIVLLALLLERLQKTTTTATTAGTTNAAAAPTRRKGLVAVFTSNLESTHRLARLLQLLWKAGGYGPANQIAEFSSSLTQRERSKLIEKCAGAGAGGRGKEEEEDDDDIVVLVSSDGMSRGMDLDVVTTVINYDIPLFAKTYVHRCGRTARAGKQGSAISLLKGGQVSQFKRMRQLIDHPDRVTPMGLKKSLVRGVVPLYRKSLRRLAEVVSAEDEGDLKPTDPIPDYILSKKKF